MKIEEFKNLRNFHISELDYRGRPIISKLSLVKSSLMYRLDEAVGFAKQEYGKDQGKFRIHCIVLDEHSENSKHYTGEAVDGHFSGLSLYEMVMIGMKAGFTGIGYYPDANTKFVHFDIREQDHISTWLFIHGEYVYDYDIFTERLLMEAA